MIKRLYYEKFVTLNNILLNFIFWVQSRVSDPKEIILIFHYILLWVQNRVSIPDMIGVWKLILHFRDQSVKPIKNVVFKLTCRLIRKQLLGFRPGSTSNLYEPETLEKRNISQTLNKYCVYSMYLVFSPEAPSSLGKTGISMSDGSQASLRTFGLDKHIMLQFMIS